MKLVIVSGAPATGKTSIGRKVADALGYAFLSKDQFKEELFDSSPTKHGFFWYEKRSKEILFSKIKENIAHNVPTVVESNFIKADIAPLKALLTKELQCVELFCYTRGFARLKRFVRRREDGKRHALYGDRKWYATTAVECSLNYVGINAPYNPLCISEKLLKVDTADFSKLDSNRLIEFAKNN